MSLPLFQVDAFTGELFRGNPAAVVPLDSWPDDALLASIAAENNLSETAFFVPEADAAGGVQRWRLRWFTPACEVDLCGHATLASAHVLREHLGAEGPLAFETRSGALGVEFAPDGYVLDLPAAEVAPQEGNQELMRALGSEPVGVFANDVDLLVQYADRSAVLALAPDFGLLGKIDAEMVIATAPDDEVDFVSRVFAPTVGIDEDPVTGAAHCVSTPFWVERLGRSRLRARQVSKRGGDLVCELSGDGKRVRLTGRACTYSVGEILL